MTASIREWLVRLGLYTAEQEVGRDGPKRHQGLQTNRVHDRMHQNSFLRLAQVFLDVNLLCQAKTFASIKEAELYFLWYMMKKRKVHLGYWLARTCQSISSRASRNLSDDHSGEDTQNELLPQPRTSWVTIPLNVDVVKKKGGIVKFYEVKRPIAQPIGANKKKSKTKIVEVVATEIERG